MLNKVCISKNRDENNFKDYFKYIILLSRKILFSNPNLILHYAIKPLGQIYKVLFKILFYFENLFLTVSKCCIEFYKKIRN
jgi:hypothetical protein